MGSIVSKENLKRKTDLSHSQNQSKRFKQPAAHAPNNGDDKNLIPFSWQNRLSLNVSIDREGKNIHSQERLKFAAFYICMFD